MTGPAAIRCSSGSQPSLPEAFIPPITRHRKDYKKTENRRRAMAKLQYRTISKRTVDGLSVDEKDIVFWDRELPGFGVRVYPSGSKGVCGSD